MSFGVTSKKSLPVAILCPLHTPKHAVYPRNSFCTLPNLFKNSLYHCKAILENSEDSALKGNCRDKQPAEDSVNDHEPESRATFRDHCTAHHLGDMGHITGGVPKPQFPHLQDRTNYFSSHLKGLT